jgi:hypothetical protein
MLKKLLLSALLIFSSWPVQALPVYPVGTNGCSGGISNFFRAIQHKVPAWESCCYAHDVSYRTGGIYNDKARADRTLLRCAQLNGGKLVGALMFIGVSIFGTSFYIFDWRRLKEDYAAQWFYSRSTPQ